MMGTYIIVILITLVLMSMYILGALTEKLYDGERVKLFAKANIISTSLAPTLNTSLATEEQQTLVSQILSGSGVRGIIVNRSYNVLIDTNSETSFKGKLFTRSIITTALGGEQASVVTQSDGVNMLAVAVPLKTDTEVIGCVYLNESVNEIDRTVSYIKMSMILFSILISVLVGMLSIAMSYIITSPIDEMIHVAQQISMGEYSNKLEVKGHSELSEMADAMNHMMGELENVENTRRKFISDVSHELKTPLATIKLISDSIASTENPDPGLINEFMGDMSVEVDRLTRIVDRLLSLTKMNKNENTLTPTPVDFPVMINAIVHRLTPNAQAKQIRLSCDVPQGPMEPLMLDYDKMWEAVYNITDNAIKYSPEGETVKVILKTEGSEIKVLIVDNGPGIAPHEKDKVFERFYRLDDSRARDTGGTGLGLAIAKEAVLLHGGRIDIISDGENGTTFEVVLPFENVINERTEQE